MPPNDYKNTLSYRLIVQQLDAKQTQLPNSPFRFILPPSYHQSLPHPMKPLNASKPHSHCSTAIPSKRFLYSMRWPTKSSLPISWYVANCWTWPMARRHGPSVKKETPSSFKPVATISMPCYPRLWRRICRRAMVRLDCSSGRISILDGRNAVAMLLQRHCHCYSMKLAHQSFLCLPLQELSMSWTK